MKSVYVGNIPYQATENEIRNLFEEHGQVNSVKFIIDRETGRPRGFGFVEMSDDDSCLRAIKELNGKEIGGRTLRINEANNRPNNSRGSFRR